MQKKQDGFGVVETLLVLVIISIVGFTGWRIYEASKEVSQVSVDNSTVQKPEDNTLPKGWKKYENKDLGFSFGYPQEWGVVTQASSPNTEGRTYEGGHYYFTFSGHQDFKVAAKTKDYKYTGLGMDAPLVNGFVNFDERYQQIQTATYGEIVRRTDDTLVYVYAEDFQGTITAQGIVKLNTLPGLDFALSIPIQTFNLPEDAYSGLYSGETSPREYLTQDQIDTVVEFAENVKFL